MIKISIVTLLVAFTGETHPVKTRFPFAAAHDCSALREVQRSVVTAPLESGFMAGLR